MTSSKRISLRKVLFFFTLAFIPFFQLSIVPTSSAEEVVVASVPANPASSSDKALIELAANFPQLHRATTQLVVNVSVNRESKGDFFAELDDQRELFFKVEDLIALKLNFSQDRIVLIGEEKCAPLNSVRDINYTFDEKDLTIAILGKTTDSEKTSIELYSLQSRPRNIYYPRETSAFFNYGLTYSYADSIGFQSFSAPTKIGVRTGDFFFISDSLYTKTETDEHLVRLSSNITHERRDDLRWLVLGDQFANSGDLGSSVNMGGIGFSKLYRIDPYFITQPLFNISGVTEFPSEAEIYMDGVLMSRRSIAPGSFELKNIYSYGGSHTIDVVLKDPFGNEQKISYPLYFSAQLLRQGLHEYSYNAGFLREQYGMQSNEYGKAVFSAFHRYGVTSSFNIGARAEGSDGVYNGGVSNSFLLPRLGAFGVSVAGSNANGTRGSAGSFQHSYQLGSFSTNLLIREYSRDYATISAAPSLDMLRYSTSLGAGFLVKALGSFSLAYSSSETYRGLNTRVLSANHSRAVTRTVNLFATASRSRTAEKNNSLFVGLNFNFDKNLRGSAQISKTGDTNTETLQFQKDTPIGQGIGYHASLNRLDTGTSTAYAFNPALQYNARYGIYSLNSNIQNSKGNTSELYTVTAAGALVYTGGFFGASRPVSDSFSMVAVGSLRDATVLNNGQEIGKTNSSGIMVVPTLASYGQNQITLDVKNLPLDYSISGVNQQISPPVWSGSCVSFEAVQVRALTGKLYLKDKDKKTPLEFVDIIMKVGDREVTFPTGKGGEFYLENALPEEGKAGTVDRQSCRAIAERRKSGGNVIMPGSYRAKVDYEGAKCEVTITFPETGDMITDIGEVRCVSAGTFGTTSGVLQQAAPGGIAGEELFDTKTASAHIEKGIAHLKADNYAEAIKEFEESTAIYPGAEAYYFLGYSYYLGSKNGDGKSRNKAMESFERTYELDPNFTPTRSKTAEVVPEHK